MLSRRPPRGSMLGSRSCFGVLCSKFGNVIKFGLHFFKLLSLRWCCATRVDVPIQPRCRTWLLPTWVVYFFQHAPGIPSLDRGGRVQAARLLGSDQLGNDDVMRTCLGVLVLAVCGRWQLGRHWLWFAMGSRSYLIALAMKLGNDNAW